MSFRVGQRVICVNNSGQEKLLVVGRIYTVTSISVSSGADIFIRVGIGGGHYHWRFRPLVERKTDISIFTAMLTPSKQKVRA